MNILYIGDPLSVHDRKWITWFAGQGTYKLHLVDGYGRFEVHTESLVAEMADLGVKLHQPLPIYSIRHRRRTRQAAERLNRLIESENINLVHVLFAAPCALWGRHLPVPFIITTRGSDVLRTIPELRRGFGWRSVHDRLLFRMFKNAFGQASAITSTSQSQLVSIKKLFGVSGHVIRTGVDVERISRLDPESYVPAIDRSRRIVFFPRFIAPNYNTLMQAHAVIALPDALLASHQFVFVDGPMTDSNYKQECEVVLRSNPGVTSAFVGPLTQEQMWAMFRISALAVMTPETDGTPNSALEAMAARCPVILGAADYDEDLFTGTCLRMKSHSVEELSGLIAVALMHYERRTVENAYDRVARLGNRSIEMQKLQQLYRSLWSSKE